MEIEGLSQKEAEIYENLLVLKRATVLELAKHAGCKRSNLYHILDHLIKLGLVSEIFEQNKHYYIAESPDKVVDYLNEEKKRISRWVNNLKHLESSRSDRPIIRFYEGKEALKNIYRELYKNCDDVKIFGNIDLLYSKYDFHGQMIQKRVKLKIDAKAILPDRPASLESSERAPRERRKNLIVPGFDPGNTLFMVSPRKVAALSYKSWLIGVLIEDTEIAKTIRALFDAVWTVYNKEK